MQRTRVEPLFSPDVELTDEHPAPEDDNHIIHVNVDGH